MTRRAQVSSALHTAYAAHMAWIKVPAEHHPIFRAALPKDARVDILPMFGGLAAKVNGNFFAGLFGRSAIVWLPEDERAEVLALDGASYFDPMGDGRRSDKVMLPEAMMEEPDELRRWIARSFKAAAKLPLKVKAPKKKTAAKKKTAPKKTAKRSARLRRGG